MAIKMTTVTVMMTMIKKSYRRFFSSKMEKESPGF